MDLELARAHMLEQQMGRRGMPPPFPFPAMWGKVAENNGIWEGRRWLVPGIAASTSLEEDLNGEGEIVLTDEWKDRLVSAAKKRQERLVVEKVVVEKKKNKHELQKEQERLDKIAELEQELEQGFERFLHTIHVSES
mmetsp:Transcript_2379/g.3447  ORF Transcript_2379/g.3447 Transcript_2379/m.3447 type:complete len:137 (+) Transcript_2379:1890-2300(+)